MSNVRTLRGAVALAGLVALSACSVFSSEYPDRQAGQEGGRPWNSLDNPDVYGTSGGWKIFDFSGGSSKPSAGVGIGINAYLWRASLDTLAFMPLASADPFGGTIITDWYAPPESPNERFKMNVYITDRDLRADGIKVSVFRQVKAGNDWNDAAVGAKTAGDLENAILTRARELRTAASTVKK